MCPQPSRPSCASARGRRRQRRTWLVGRVPLRPSSCRCRLHRRVRHTRRVVPLAVRSLQPGGRACTATQPQRKAECVGPCPARWLRCFQRCLILAWVASIPAMTLGRRWLAAMPRWRGWAARFPSPRMLSTAALLRATPLRAARLLAGTPVTSARPAAVARARFAAAASAHAAYVAAPRGTNPSLVRAAPAWCMVPRGGVRRQPADASSAAAWVPDPTLCSRPGVSPVPEARGHDGVSLARRAPLR